MNEQPKTYLGLSATTWLEMLNNECALERRLAAHALGELGAAAADTAPGLQTALHDETPFVRIWAAAGLARVDPSDATSIPALIGGMQDPLAFIRSLAAWHIGRLGPDFPKIEDTLPGLRRLLEDGDANVRTEAALALRCLDGKGAPPLELQFMSRLSTFSLETVLRGECLLESQKDKRRGGRLAYEPDM